MNINRDYLIILDVKSGEVDSPNIYYFNTDKNTSNLYVQMVIKETNIEATPIDNATNYSIKANILKPNMVGKIVEGNLVNEAKAIYEFKLPADCTDFSGNAKIEFEVYCTVDGVEEIATSFATKFKVHGSVLTEQNKYIEDSSDYPILKELMAEAKELNTQSKELNADSRKLHEELSGALEAEEQRKSNESDRIANENTRIEAETDRIEAESSRISAETDRIDNENIRESNEATREVAEQTRRSNETTRIANENARKEAETARAGAEDTRVTAENNREAQETLRQEAEAARVAAEQDRAERIARVEQDNAIMRQEIDTTKVIVENQNDKIRRITDSDTRQDILINGLYNSYHGRLTATQEGNIVSLPEAKYGIATVDEIVGNTMVNCNKEADKSIVLTELINEEGTSNITLTQGVDGAKADVYVEGNTMVNVCDQEEAVAITTNTNTFPLRYLYASTNYILQFESDTNVTIDITLGDYTLSSQNIAVGLNKINITTPDTLADNNLVLDGIGFNASNIVVTEAVEGDFGYFKGMKSVGEQEGKVEVVSRNSDDTQSNKQELTHDPLRKVGDVADRYVLIDGKWYIERNCSTRAYEEGDIDIYKTDRINTVYPLASPVYEPIDYNPFDIYSDTTHISVNSNIPAKIKARNHGYNCMVKPSTTYTATYNVDGVAQKTTIVTPETLDDATRFTGTGTLDNFLLLEGDISNPPAFFAGMRSCFDQEYDEEKGKWKVNIRVVGKNKFNGLGIGHGYINPITGDIVLSKTNIYFDFIPINVDEIYISAQIDVRGAIISQYDINKKFLKATDKAVPRRETLDKNTKFIRISVNYDKDVSSSLLDRNKVQIEEGDTATEYEPYTYNDITIYINEPLRKGDIIRAENRKILVERHSGSGVLDGSDDENWWKTTIYSGDRKNTIAFRCPLIGANQKGKVISNSFKFSQYLWENDIECISIIENDNIDIRIAKTKLLKYNGSYDTDKLKQWLSENPVTVVYELASPVIEEVQTDYTRLMLECYENATVYFNSHIPPTSTIRYTANVISTTEIMSVNDEQDSMIIDNATQIAMITLTM